MKALYLAGWGQPADSLRLSGVDAQPFSYADYDTLQTALGGIAEHAVHCDAVIGWSLGGQLAVLATAAGLMQPKKLVLVAAPFQFVASNKLELGMNRAQFALFRDNYIASPKRTLDKAWELVIKDDKHGAKLRQEHMQQGKDAMLQQNWQNWLKQLDGISCHDVALSNLPPTLLLHGTNDVVVDVAQSHHYAKHIPDSKLVTFSGCGHAPHWHAPDKVQVAIKEFLHV